MLSRWRGCPKRPTGQVVMSQRRRVDFLVADRFVAAFFGAFLPTALFGASFFLPAFLGLAFLLTVFFPVVLTCRAVDVALLAAGDFLTDAFLVLRFGAAAFLPAACLDPTTVIVPGPGMTLDSSPEFQRMRRRAPLVAT